MKLYETFFRLPISTYLHITLFVLFYNQHLRFTTHTSTSDILRNLQRHLNFNKYYTIFFKFHVLLCPGTFTPWFQVNGKNRGQCSNLQTMKLFPCYSGRSPDEDLGSRLNVPIRPSDKMTGRPLFSFIHFFPLPLNIDHTTGWYTRTRLTDVHRVFFFRLLFVTGQNLNKNTEFPLGKIKVNSFMYFSMSRYHKRILPRRRWVGVRMCIGEASLLYIHLPELKSCF